MRAELDRRLSPEERALVINPVEVTPELVAEARRLTAGLPNESTRVLALFSEVARRGRGSGRSERWTAGDALKASRDSRTRFVCQEYAKLFVGLARAVGIEAWLVHIDRDAGGYPGYHDCAVVFLNGQGIIVDPTWRMMAFQHQEFTVLDDLQVISHHMMQPTETGRTNLLRLQVGRKLNPDDRWTQLQFVRGMAQGGQYAAAQDELNKVMKNSATWDVYEAEARLHSAQGNPRAAVVALQKAFVMSPSNAVVHAALSDVYDSLEDPVKSKEHLEAALRLNRGEISEEVQQRMPFKLALLQASAQTKSPDQSSRADVERKAEAGDLAAQMMMAKVCFEAGPTRFEEGLRWLGKAAEQGEEQAQFNYGKNLLSLRGSEAANESIEWLTRAAEQGNGDAQHLLGLILYDKQFVPRDSKASYGWVLLAANQGHKEAKWLVKEMELFLSPTELAEARQRAAAFKPAKKSRTRN